LRPRSPDRSVPHVSFARLAEAPGLELVQHQNLTQAWRSVPEAYTCFTMIEDLIAEDDKVVCRNTWRATDTVSGSLISFKGIVIWRFANDKIVERWASVEPPRSE
jgi:predicted ester cyclase